jgi:hypothetical protein
LVLNLKRTSAGAVVLDPASFPSNITLRLDGFIYDQIKEPDGLVSLDASAGLEWLHLQLPGLYLSQPYEQLASFMHTVGLEEEAKKVLIAKNEDHARHVDSLEAWIWLKVVGPIIGYGYLPLQALGLSLVVIVVGWVLFLLGARGGLMTPTEDRKSFEEKNGRCKRSELYPKFNPFFYYLETFVPLMQLALSRYWMPNANRGTRLSIRGRQLCIGGIQLPTTGGCLRFYLWFHIILGWFLTTLWVIGLTGLVKT